MVKREAEVDQLEEDNNLETMIEKISANGKGESFIEFFNFLFDTFYWQPYPFLSKCFWYSAKRKINKEEKVFFAESCKKQKTICSEFCKREIENSEINSILSNFFHIVNNM